MKSSMRKLERNKMKEEERNPYHRILGRFPLYQFHFSIPFRSFVIPSFFCPFFAMRWISICVQRIQHQREFGWTKNGQVMLAPFSCVLWMVYNFSQKSRSSLTSSRKLTSISSNSSGNFPSVTTTYPAVIISTRPILHTLSTVPDSTDPKPIPISQDSVSIHGAHSVYEHANVEFGTSEIQSTHNPRAVQEFIEKPETSEPPFDARPASPVWNTSVRFLGHRSPRSSSLRRCSFSSTLLWSRYISISVSFLDRNKNVRNLHFFTTYFCSCAILPFLFSV